MKLRSLVIWTGATAGAATLTWAAHRGPPPQSATPTPAALPRPPSPAEWAAVQAQAQAMTEAIQEASQRTGRLPGIGELESTDPEGRRWLPQGLSDNPLLPGVGTVGAGCGPPPALTHDWWYCERTGHFQPGGSHSGNE